MENWMAELEGEDSGSREAEWMRNWTPLAADYGEYDPLRAGSIDGTGTAPHDRAIVRAMRAKCAYLLFFGKKRLPPICFLQLSRRKM